MSVMNRKPHGLLCIYRLEVKHVKRTDSEIERDVVEELKWSPDMDSTDTAVKVKNGVVTLAGFVKSYVDKTEAEAAAKRVAGVLAVANDLAVRLPATDERPDPEIVREAVASLKRELPISAERIKVVVKNGWLEGTVEWQYQRNIAESAVGHISGVKSVTNLIELSPRAEPIEIKKRIEESFRRSAEIDANRVTVEANGSEVVLKRSVDSWAEREEAERAAWAAPGVTKVEDRVVVSP
jgi:osmotically-inducible protein OsmY